jgi:hypothetical protein
MSLYKQHKPDSSNQNRSNDMFIRPSAAQIVQMNKDNPDRKVTNSDFDPEVKLNHFGEPAFIQPNSTVQARLKMGQVNDKYEKEADSVADKVVNRSMTHGQGATFGADSSIQKQEEKEAEVQAKPIGETISPLVQKMESEDDPVQRVEEEEVQQKKNEGGTNNPTSIESRLNSSKGGGSKLDVDTKSQMESGFGLDFSSVNIHTDSNAVQMSEDIGAKAFTNGNDVYFNKGEYNPSSKQGKHLLAHELTHTLQQGQGEGKIQRAETDTATKGSEKIEDSKTEINTYVNAVLAEAKKLSKINEKVNYIKSMIAEGTGWSKIEHWVNDNLPDSKKYLPSESDTKYAGTTDSMGVTDKGKMWALAETFGFKILNPSIKVNGILIGSDKLGHFFQQGLQYLNEAGGEKTGTGAAEEFGKGTEEDGYGLNTTGVYSNADLKANSSGLNFWFDYIDNPNMKFDISNYIDSTWNEEFNPNFYAPKVGKTVWNNLINNASGGYISYPSLDSNKVKGDAELSLVDKKVVGSISYSVPDKDGTFKLSLNGTLSHIKDNEIGGSVDAISKVRIAFNWTHDNGKSGTGVLWSYKEKSLSGKLKIDKGGTKLDYRKIRIDL